MNTDNPRVRRFVVLFIPTCNLHPPTSSANCPTCGEEKEGTVRLQDCHQPGGNLATRGLRADTLLLLRIGVSSGAALSQAEAEPGCLSPRCTTVYRAAHTVGTHLWNEWTSVQGAKARSSGGQWPMPQGGLLPPRVPLAKMGLCCPQAMSHRSPESPAMGGPAQG